MSVRASRFDTAETILLENRREKRGCHTIAMTDAWVHFHLRSKFLGSCEAKTVFLWGLQLAEPRGAQHLSGLHITVIS